MSLWRPRQNDLPALLGIAIIPLVVALPELAGLLHDNPLIYLSDAARNVRGGWLPGYPYIDPNDAYTTQALGRLVATDWWHGLIPWWNPYSGVGLPLAAEYQPAAFFPLTLLLRFPGGMIWVHLLLQILAGWGAYALLRQLGVRRLAALTGGILFAQNGTLAWFAHASAGPVPFLPWVLLGIERAVAKASLRDPFGWRMLAVAIAMMLLAGFPETAYICGLFALAWSVLRLAQYKSGCRLSVMWRILLGEASVSRSPPRKFWRLGSSCHTLLFADTLEPLPRLHFRRRRSCPVCLRLMPMARSLPMAATGLP